jgi:cytidylate kinase
MSLTDSPGLVVTIDGPAASGKSTTARLVANKLGWLFLDTGAMYRAITVKVLENGLKSGQTGAIARLAEETRVELLPDPGGCLVYMDGRDVTKRIRQPEIDRAVGPVCEIPRVRSVLVALQRELGKKGRVVAEGRDMGTVVFPDADLKFYMVASLEERARRRQQDNVRQGISRSLESVKEEIRQRDERDSRRSHSPLKPARDAVLIDTSRMSIEDQVGFILDRIRLITGDQSSSSTEG